MTARHLVLRPGDRVVASGHVIHDADGVWLDPPLPRNSDEPGHASPFAVPLSDPAAVDSASTWTRLRGVWLGDAIRVETQTAPGPERPAPSYIDPPCPPPPGGWPHNTSAGRGFDLDTDDDVDIAKHELLVSGTAIIATALFRPSNTQVVLVIVTTDVDAVRTRLEPLIPGRLCVVRSRWAESQIAAANTDLLAHSRTWQLLSRGLRTSESMQVAMHLELVRVTEDVAAWADAQPAGLVELEPWLQRLQ